MTVGDRDATEPVLDVSHDAVVIIPGIMGSELVDAVSGRTLWGMRDPRWYVSAWSTGRGLADLRLSADEAAGRYGRVRATRLLQFPAFARVLAGAEPYTRLVEKVRQVVVDPAAVLEFPYDWRLPVAYNAGLLAAAADAHLRRWRASPSHGTARRAHPTGREAQLVIVAHSMGGLLARYLTTIAGAADDVRATITLGTPFYGSVRATVLLNSGRGAPVPLPAYRPIAKLLHKRVDDGLRALATTLPGVHDLLPTYRCLDETHRARVLTAGDIADLGGDRELADAAFALQRRLDGVVLPGHRAVVGTEQPTPQSIKLQDGVVTAHPYTCEGSVGKPINRVDRKGDATVYRDAAAPRGASLSYVAQQHGSLANTDESITIVRAVITERDLDQLGPPLGAGEIGIDLPDVVAPGERWPIVVTGVEHPGSVRCIITDVASGRPVAVPPAGWYDGVMAAQATLRQPGLYRVKVAGGGATPVDRLVLVADPSLADD
jgi:hypothetical protein